MLWLVALGADVVVAAACLATAVLLGRKAALSTGQARVLPFGTALIFLTVAAHHAARGFQLLYLDMGLRGESGAAARIESGDWHVATVAVLVGVASLVYLRLRGRYGSLLDGPTLYEDLDAGHRRAIGLHDTVVQSLTQAAWALDLGQRQLALDAIDQTLEQARALLDGPEGRDG